MKAGLAAALALMVAACATTAYAPAPTPAPAPVGGYPAAAGSSGVSAPLKDLRVLMVDNAIAMLGQPYRYGGAAPGGFDCSGLVVYAANGAGVRLPRTAREQLGIGKHIARGELQAGDLVFMHLTHKELHVGIAIDAERFVHAPSTGGAVRIDTLASPTYSKGFLGARRIALAQ